MNSNSSYLVNFVIPQGPTGPTGATGPTGSSSGLTVYGGKFSNTSQTINLTAGTQVQVPLGSTLSSNNVTYTQTNSITVGQGGIYEITYYTNLSATVATTLTFAIRNSGTNITSTVMSRAISVGASAIFSGSTIVNLNAGSVIDMALSASLALGVTLGTGVNAILTVKKLN